ncbi:MAG: hypothetical protein ACRC3J_05740 [Culicoidibacterales bacterium]
MKLTKMQYNSLELFKDIIATASVLIKFEMDGEILSTQSNFIAFLNEAGYRTVTGRLFTKMNFRKMIEKFTPEQIQEALSEFTADRRYQLFSR